MGYEPTSRGQQTVNYAITGDQQAGQREFTRKGEADGGSDGGYHQESELRSNAGLVVRGRIHLSKLVGWCQVPLTMGGELTGIGSCIISRSSPLESGS